jgi:CO/xanthine dehydrogenase FAD-binding subunit
MAALNLLENDGGKSKVIAGGQSLVPMMNIRVVRPDRLIDISRISEIDEGPDVGLKQPDAGVNTSLVNQVRRHQLQTLNAMLRRLLIGDQLA